MKLKEYLLPQTIEECMTGLAQNNGEARIIAGGTDLVLWLKQKKVKPQILVDITFIQELRALEFSDDYLIIGGAVTHAQVASHSRIRNLLPVLSEACESIGSPQIRNIATVVGNIVSAQPAADSAVALVALRAQAEILSQEGYRIEPVEELYADFGKSKIDSSRELVTRIKVPLPDSGTGTAFMRNSPRNALSLPVINVAIVLNVFNGRVNQGRIAIGPVAAGPFRPLQAEKLLAGIEISDNQSLERIAEVASQEGNPRDSLLRGSSLYRRHLVRVLIQRAMETAIRRAVANTI
ncbi:MAG: FAD binding domain-containing protein [Bacillota bacterium]